MIRIITALYSAAWLIALPFLRFSPRISQGWRQRTLQAVQAGPFDLWIQAASGGEAMITVMVLQELETATPPEKKLRILVTSGTSQGVETLTRLCREQCSRLDIQVGFFPFDAPFLMRRGFQVFRPEAAVIVETELWPGFLMAAKESNTPVMLINGRLSEKSYRSYRYARPFFKKFGPAKVLAISPEARDRFSDLVSFGNTALMNNIKFDRLNRPAPLLADNPIARIIPAQIPSIVLGSIRREEETRVLKTIKQLHLKKPDCIIGLFPKHIERADSWLNQLEQEGIPAVKRSLADTPQPAGTVIVWDLFGELTDAYAVARAAFVGGSLENLGGQNFLEPLISGLRPCIGPYWKNFDWVGTDIFRTGLVRQVADEHELAAELLANMEIPDDRDEIIRRVQDFFSTRKGGTHQACLAITDMMNSVKTN